MKLKMMMIIVAALTLGACAKKKSANLRSSRAGASNVGLVGNGTTSCNQDVWGRVYSQTMDVNSFTQMLTQFTGETNMGTVDPSYYSTTTGVDFQMSVYFSGNQFNAASSRLLIKVIDSYATPTYNYILVPSPGKGPMKGQSGQVLGSGTFRATFSDDAGTVTVQGQRTTINGQPYIYGNISFQNSNGTSGNMGEFLISNCALVGL